MPQLCGFLPNHPDAVGFPSAAPGVGPGLGEEPGGTEDESRILKGGDVLNTRFMMVLSAARSPSRGEKGKQ